MKRLFFPIGYALLAACQQTSTAQQAQDTVAAETDSVYIAAITPSERDTITIGEVLYYINDIDKADFEAVPAYDRSWENEKENLSSFAGKVSRVGDSLVFKLTNDSVFVLMNKRSDGEDHEEYYFLDHMPALKAYLVYGLGYEYFSYLLIDETTGVKTPVIGIPQLSPDKKRFICSNSDLVAAFTTNGFQLFDAGQYKAGPVQERLPETWGPVTIKWKDAQSFVAHFNELAKDMDQTDRYVKLVPGNK